MRLVFARDVEGFDSAVYSAHATDRWVVAAPDPYPLLLHSELLRLTALRGGDFSEGSFTEKRYIDLDMTFPRAVESIVRSLSTGYLEFLPEDFDLFLDVAMQWNIPVAVEAVMNAASSVLGAALDADHSRLNDVACGVEVARKVQQVWKEVSQQETWAGYPWFQYMRGMALKS